MRSVLITGACGGMGRATALKLSAMGYKVFAMDISPSAAEGKIVPIKADITSEESVNHAFEEIARQTDSLYAILHFAGIYMLDSLVEMSADSFDKIVDVNFRGAFLVNKTFLPLLKKGSRILLTTSELAALDPLPFTGVYAVTKCALDKYAYSLRMELQLLDIKVSVLRAGAVKTNMLSVSTRALDDFCEKTELYSCNANRFKAIVNSVESRYVSPDKIAEKAVGIIHKRSPAFAYSINRNPLLVLLDILPARMRFLLIRMILQK